MSSLSILDDDEHFQRCFNVVLKRVQQVGTFTEWLYDNAFHDIQTKVISSVGNSTKGTLRTLGVGSGAGKTEDFFVSHFKPRVEKVYQCIVEPNKQLVQQHKDNVAKTGMLGITYDWRELTIEEYMENMTGAEHEENFHFISSIHSVYHFSDPTKLLGYLYDQLEVNGVLLLVISAESAMTAHLHGPAIIPHEYSRYYCTIKHVRDYFDSRRIPYGLYTRKQKLDVSGCLEDNDDIAEESTLIIDFLTHVKEFRTASIPKDIKDKFFTKLIQNADLSDGKQEVDASNHAIVVQRKS